MGCALTYRAYTHANRPCRVGYRCVATPTQSQRRYAEPSSATTAPTSTLRGMRSVSVCSWTSVLVPAFFAGFAVASLFGSDVAGWVAAVVVGMTVAAYQARTGASAACGLPQPRDDADDRIAAGPTARR